MKESIFDELKRQIEQYQTEISVEDAGRVIESKDGVVRVVGLTNAQMGEMIKVSDNVPAMVLSLENGSLLAVLLGEAKEIREGDLVFSTGELVSVNVSETLIGRVVDALGNPIDGKVKIEPDKKYPIERKAPGVIERKGVSNPLQTGILAIDALVPIGRGQRELIIGDRFTGKTAIAIDTIINQKEKEVICIYVGIGQKQAKMAQLVGQLRDHGAMDYTIVVSACASDSAPAQMIAPFTGCAIGEYFMDKGKDVLIIYDDLTKHAWAYRQISLGLRRPPGREAYPGDIFYLHSRLLERAARMSDELGGGSLTALPIIETLAGDVSSYIPTNVISITDGQIYLDKDTFNAGNRPAIDAGLSVSRVGGAAQIKAMKSLSGPMRLDLAQYRDLVGFAQFGSDLDPETKMKINRGRVNLEILKQEQFLTLPVTDQVITLFAADGGYMDELPPETIKEKVGEFIKYINESRQDIVLQLEKEKAISDEMKITLNLVCNDFFKEEEDV